MFHQVSQITQHGAIALGSRPVAELCDVDALTRVIGKRFSFLVGPFFPSIQWLSLTRV